MSLRFSAFDALAFEPHISALALRSTIAKNTVSLPTWLTYAIAAISLYSILAIIVESARASRMGNRQYRARCTYPHSEPLLGLDLLWQFWTGLKEHRFLSLVKGLLTNHGTTVEYMVLGSKAIITIEPKNIQALLSTKFADFGLGEPRKSTFKPLLGNGIFNADGERWKHSRTILKQGLVRNPDSDLITIERHVQSLFSALGSKGQVVDIQQLFGILALDIASDIYLGHSFHTLTEAKQARRNDVAPVKFASAFAYAQEAISGVRQPDLFTSFKSAVMGDPELDVSVKIVNDFLDSTIREKAKSPSVADDNSSPGDSPTTLLEYLMNHCESHEEVKEELTSVLLAGKDATTSLHSSLWFALSKHPEVWAKVKQETEQLNCRVPTAADLNGMQYLHRTVREVLRLFPPVPLNQRTAEVDTWLPLGGGPTGEGPMFVPKGTSICYSVHALHRRKDVYGDSAEHFDPDRWATLRPGWAFLPFHGGPRSCLGQQFAMLLAKYVTVRLVQSFESVHNHDQQPWQEQLGLNCLSRHGVSISLGAESTSHSSR